MANIPSVAKRARQSVKRRARNATTVSTLKTAKKKARSAAASGNPQEALAAYSDLASKLDKAAKRGVIHPNAADRGKSRARKALSVKA